MKEQLIVTVFMCFSIFSACAADSPSRESENLNDFELNLDELCTILKQSFDQDIPIENRALFVEQAIDSRIKNDDVRSLFSAIFLEYESDRYPLFIESVEAYTKKDWSCTPLKKYLSK